MAATYLGVAEVGKAYFFRHHEQATAERPTGNPQAAPGDAT
jgi:hypothetical protein